MVSLSPLTLLSFILMALKGLLGFLSKVALLSTIVAINTPFAAMYNMSALVCKYKKLDHSKNLRTRWNWQDAKANVGIEIKLFVADFIKVVAGELLVVVSTGIITYYTAPLLVFCISTLVWVIAIFHKWLNTNCISRTALSCLCDALGLSPLTFLCSDIGFFDIGCHPVAKCTFAARHAFQFVKNEDDKEKERSQLNKKDRLEGCIKVYPFDTNVQNERRSLTCKDCEEGKGGKECNDEANEHLRIKPIEFDEWNAFDTDMVFQLNPKIELTVPSGRHYILKSCMVLKVFGKKVREYHVETLELPEDYSKDKAIELQNFLWTLSINDGFVTDEMRGQYEHSMTLSQIVEGVQKSEGYKITEPIDNSFVVVGTCTSL